MRCTPEARAAALRDLDERNLRRRRTPAEDGRVNFCSNDYLGLSRHPSLVAAAQAAARRPLAAVERDAHAALLKAGFERIDYVAVRRADDLGAFRDGVVDAPARILAAAWLGRTRLIDNMAVAAPA